MEGNQLQSLQVYPNILERQLFQPVPAMPEEQTVLRLVKDSDPESFVSVTTDHRIGRITDTRFFTEEEVRENFLQAGITKAMIEEKLRLTRENPA